MNAYTKQPRRHASLVLELRTTFADRRPATRGVAATVFYDVRVPCYLFTLHGHRTWMPNHPRGYTTRDKGYRAPDEAIAKAYERVAKYAKVAFEPQLQRWLIDELLISQSLIDVRLHAATTESTHVHFLVSWSHDRTWESVRASLRTSMTRRARRELQFDPTPRDLPPLFSDGGSRRHVKDRAHFTHLVETYLPGHSGVQWYEASGWRNLPIDETQ